MVIFTLILLLSFSVCSTTQANNYNTTTPTWVTSPYFRANNEAVISSLADNTSTPTYTFIFSSPLSGIPNLAYGIKTYFGDDFLWNEQFSINRTGLTSSTFSVQIKIIQTTNIMILNVAYLAVDPSFPHHLNSFDDVPVNVSNGPLVNISQRQNSVRYYTNCINYTQQSTGNLYTTFNNNTPLNSNKVVLFVTTLGVKSWNDRIKLNVNYHIVNSSHYQLNVTMAMDAVIVMLHFSQIIYNEDDVLESGKYAIIFEELTYSHLGGYYEFPFEFKDNMIMALTDFEVDNSNHLFDYNWEYVENQGGFVEAIKVHESVGKFGRGFNQTQSTIFYIKTWQCLSPYVFFNLTTNLCQNSCSLNYYANFTSQICQPCHYSCQECFGGENSNACLTCPQNSERFLLNGTSCPCRDGYFDSDSGDPLCVKQQAVTPMNPIENANEILQNQSSTQQQTSHLTPHVFLKQKDTAIISAVMFFMGFRISGMEMLYVFQNFQLLLQSQTDRGFQLSYNFHGFSDKQTFPIDIKHGNLMLQKYNFMFLLCNVLLGVGLLLIVIGQCECFDQNGVENGNGESDSENSKAEMVKNSEGNKVKDSSKSNQDQTQTLKQGENLAVPSANLMLQEESQNDFTVHTTKKSIDSKMINLQSGIIATNNELPIEPLNKQSSNHESSSNKPKSSSESSSTSQNCSLMTKIGYVTLYQGLWNLTINCLSIFTYQLVRQFQQQNLSDYLFEFECLIVILTYLGVVGILLIFLYEKSSFFGENQKAFKKDMHMKYWLLIITERILASSVLAIFTSAYTIYSLLILKVGTICVFWFYDEGAFVSLLHRIRSLTVQLSHLLLIGLVLVNEELFKGQSYIDEHQVVDFVYLCLMGVTFVVTVGFVGHSVFQKIKKLLRKRGNKISVENCLGNVIDQRNGSQMGGEAGEEESGKAMKPYWKRMIQQKKGEQKTESNIDTESKGRHGEKHATTEKIKIKSERQIKNSKSLKMISKGIQNTNEDPQDNVSIVFD